MANPIIDPIKNAAIETEADAINRLQDVANNLIKALDERAAQLDTIVSNQIHALLLAAADERKAWIADAHGLLDRFNGLTVTLPPRAKSE